MTVMIRCGGVAVLLLLYQEDHVDADVLMGRPRGAMVGREADTVEPIQYSHTVPRALSGTLTVMHNSL